MLTAEEARARILALIARLDERSEAAPVDQAIGRALANPLVSLKTLPPWDNSAMDGYAVRSADLPGSSMRVETVFAGQIPTRKLGPGECARIMTGAPMPEGADAVVMQEKVRVEGDRIHFADPAAPRQFVRDRGEDSREGEPLLPRGAVIGLPEAALLWAQGYTQVPVPARPRVAIASTGDELRPVGQPLGPGQLTDTNSPVLAAAVRQLGGIPVPLGLARDDLDELTALLERGLSECDVLITSAGASVGEKDFAREALTRLGVELDFWKVAIKPGKPLAVGRRGNTLVFGLPGNPTSSLVSFELFVRPALRRLLGWSEVEPARVSGRLAGAYRKPAGLAHYVRVTARWDGATLVATPLVSQTSGAVRSAVAATHLLEVGPSTTELAMGDAVTLLPVGWGR
jgi:molybdopterin molybdotransferase